MPLLKEFFVWFSYKRDHQLHLNIRIQSEGDWRKWRLMIFVDGERVPSFIRCPLTESHFADSHFAESHFADSHFAELPNLMMGGATHKININWFVLFKYLNNRYYQLTVALHLHHRMSQGSLPLCQIPLRRIPFCRISLCQIPLCRIPLCRFPFRRIPLGRFPLGRIPLGRFPLGRIPLGRIPLCRISWWVAPPDCSASRLWQFYFAHTYNCYHQPFSPER